MAKQRWCDDMVMIVSMAHAIGWLHIWNIWAARSTDLIERMCTTGAIYSTQQLWGCGSACAEIDQDKFIQNRRIKKNAQSDYDMTLFFVLIPKREECAYVNISIYCRLEYAILLLLFCWLLVSLSHDGLWLLDILRAARQSPSYPMVRIVLYIERF